jgi:hypothetical protein
MDISYFIKIVTLIVAISVAAERIVELVKGLIGSIANPLGTWLNTQNSDPVKETRRQLVLHLMALGAGIWASYLGATAIKTALGIGVMESIDGWIFVFGLCASGGSSFWNSILTFLVKAKDVKVDESDKSKRQAEVDKAAHAITMSGLQAPLKAVVNNPGVSPDIRARAAHAMAMAAPVPAPAVAPVAHGVAHGPSFSCSDSGITQLLQATSRQKGGQTVISKDQVITRLQHFFSCAAGFDFIHNDNFPGSLDHDRLSSMEDRVVRYFSDVGVGDINPQDLEVDTTADFLDAIWGAIPNDRQDG